MSTWPKDVSWNRVRQVCVRHILKSNVLEFFTHTKRNLKENPLFTLWHRKRIQKCYLVFFSTSSVECSMLGTDSTNARCDSDYAFICMSRKLCGYTLSFYRLAREDYCNGLSSNKCPELRGHCRQMSLLTGQQEGSGPHRRRGQRSSLWKNTSVALFFSLTHTKRNDVVCVDDPRCSNEGFVQPDRNDRPTWSDWYFLRNSFFHNKLQTLFFGL